MMLTGYKLEEISTNDVIQSWGGVWGQAVPPPNILSLPNGNVVYCPELNTNYSGYHLVEWYVEEPPMPPEPEPQPPISVTPRQARLALYAAGLLDQVETLIAQQDQATKIAWEYASEFSRYDPLLNQLAQNLNLTKEQIDEFFITAANL